VHSWQTLLHFNSKIVAFEVAMTLFLFKKPLFLVFFKKSAATIAIVAATLTIVEATLAKKRGNFNYCCRNIDQKRGNFNYC
jgi:hypothetical protein